MVYSLKQIVTLVEGGFRTLFGDREGRVSAEVLKIKDYRSRMYIDLVQVDESGDVEAKVTSVLRDVSLMRHFLRETGLRLSELESKTLMLRVKCTFHHQRGFSLSIQEISAEYTLGKQKKQQTDIVATLKKQGIYTKNKQTTRGVPPYRLAIVSSRTSEGLKDFRSVLDESGYAWEMDLYHSTVHGNSAKEQVGAVLAEIRGSLMPYNAVCIMRGGGGAEGFAWQNDLEIATHICQMPVPVLVAIGHTSDTSVLDEVAFASPKTPTDAAYLVIQMCQYRDDRVEQIYMQIERACEHKLEHIASRVESLYADIGVSAERRRTYITSSLEQYWTTIQSFAPAEMLRKGYSVVADTSGVLLSSEEIGELGVGDVVVVKTRGRELAVRVEV